MKLKLFISSELTLHQRKEAQDSFCYHLEIMISRETALRKNLKIFERKKIEHFRISLAL